MSSPVMTTSTVGNALAAVSLGAGKNTGIYLNGSANFDDHLTVRMSAVTAAATSGLKVDAAYVYGGTTLNGAIIATATAMTLTAIAGAARGQKIFIAPDGTNPGEVVTTTGVPVGSTVAISATTYAHANNAPVYFIEQAPMTTVTLCDPSTGAAANNTTYGRTLMVGTGTWAIILTNLDATNAVTIECSLGAITGLV